MKASHLVPLVFGIALIGLGVLSLIGNIFLQVEAWRLWPVIVIVAGLLLTIPGFFGLANRGLGAFFIPGIPVLTTGGILLVASLSQNWGLWAAAWPLEILGVALGFILAAIFMRVPALMIPACIIGINGLMLAFCNVTQLWQAWALLWPIEPLAIGIGLLILGIAKRSSGINFAGIILCTIAGVGFFFTASVSFFNLTVLRFAVPFMLVMTGIIIAVMSFFQPKAAQSAIEPEVAEA